MAWPPAQFIRKPKGGVFLLLGSLQICVTFEIGPFREAVYEIEALNPNHLNHGVRSFMLNSRSIAGNLIRSRFAAVRTRFKLS